MIAMSRWAWLAAFAIGCGHPSAPANPGRGSAPADASVDAPIALENDLPRLGATDQILKSYPNADVIDANRKLLRGDRERVKAMRAELDKHQVELDASAKAIVESPTMQKCSQDPGFAKALDRLGGEG